MRTFKKVLNGKGLLAASIAMLSGHALAETAGRVSFVSGDASVTGKDGSVRALQRGEAINGGDRITTRAGRVQIRFTDGGFVSLQPNTVFGVDEYLYANRKPEETSLFFSLVQGGMRTITGAIGKVNKKSYQVRTPVATIGIRGTEYLAQVNERGLVVSVGKGFVNVANPRGDITAGARQNIRVSGQNAKPELTEEKAEVLATRANGERRQRRQGDGEDKRTVTISDAQNSRGDYVFLFTTSDSLADSTYPDGPEYVLESPVYNYSDGVAAFYADFDQSGAVTGSEGGLQKLYYQYGSGDSSSYISFDSGTLQVKNSGTIGGVSWGEFTNGTALTSDFFSSASNPMSLSDTEFVPYVIGLPAKALLPRGFATYSLQGATPVRDSNTGEAGSVDSFVLKVNLDFATLDAVLKLSMPSNSYTVSTASSVALSGSGPIFSPGPMVGPAAVAGSGGSATGFSINSSQLTVADSNGDCASASGSGCSAFISGFFAGTAGSQVGATYNVSNYTGGNYLSGVAALGLSGLQANAPWLPDSTGGVPYQLRSPKLNASWGYNLQDLRFDKTGTVTGAVGGLMAAYGAAQVSPVYVYGPLFDSGTLQVVNSGTIGGLTWGEFTNGDAAANLSNSPFTGSNPLSLSSTQFLPYIAGAPTSPINGHGFATYTLQSATPVRDASNGQVGTVSNFAMKVNLDYGTLDAVLRLAMPTNTYTAVTRESVALAGSGALGSPFTVQSYQMTVTDTAGGCAAVTSGSGSCGASIDGFFAGVDSSQIGASYWLKDYTSGADLSGVAALAQTGTSANSNVLPDSTGGIDYLLASTRTIPGDLRTGMPVQAKFDRDGSVTGTIGGLKSMSFYTSGSFSGTFTSSYGYFTSGSLQVLNSGSIGVLTWGEYSNGAATENTIFDCSGNCFGPGELTLGSNEFVPYVLGATPIGNLGKGTARYTLQGKSPARDNLGRVGTLDKFEIDVDLDFATIDARLRVSMPGATVPADTSSGTLTVAANSYGVETNGPVALLNLGTASTFSLDSTHLVVSDTAGNCANSGSSSCSASITGFFAGDASSQIGASYNIYDYYSAYTNIGGVAALGLTGYNPDATLASGGGYSAAWAAPTGTGTAGGHAPLGTALDVTFGTPAAAGATPGMDNASGLNGQMAYVDILDRGDALVADTGSAGALNWGRWYTSSVASITVDGGVAELGSSDSLHYIVGPMTQPNVFAGITQAYGSFSSATYTYQGGTGATATDGGTGTVASGSSIGVTFSATPTLWLNLNVSMNSGNSYSLGSNSAISIQSVDLPVFSASTADGNLSCSAYGGANSGSCNAALNGFFAGQQAQQIGLGYRIEDIADSRTVSGAAAFGRGAISNTPN